MTKNRDLERVKFIEVRGDKFKLDITTLSVAKFLQIETNKQVLSRNEYYQLATTWFTNTANAVNLIDMIATFRVLAPEIEKGLPVSFFEELNVLDTKEILQIYVKEVAPWYNGWMNEFNEPFEIKEETEDDDINSDE